MNWTTSIDVDALHECVVRENSARLREAELLRLAHQARSESPVGRLAAAVVAGLLQIQRRRRTVP
jgi:hypothetical protein